MGRYCVIGEHLPHTKSKEIHELFGCELYEVVELEKEDVGKLLTSKYYDGMNVTIPYKQLVIPYLDYIDDIFDSFKYLDDILIVQGKRENDFAPVKNKEGNDSPASAKELYENYYNNN